MSHNKDRRSFTDLANANTDRLVVKLSDGSFLEGLATDTVETLRGVFTIEPIITWSFSLGWLTVSETPAKIESEAKRQSSLKRLAAMREGIKK